MCKRRDQDHDCSDPRFLADRKMGGDRAQTPAALAWRIRNRTDSIEIRVGQYRPFNTSSKKLIDILFLLCSSNYPILKFLSSTTPYCVFQHRCSNTLSGLII
ncbi:unnamed protein product, partial [Larinioides sclopetarius]